MYPNSSRMLGEKNVLSRHVNYLIDPGKFTVKESAVANLLFFKANERKNDPDRVPGIHGPFEELTIRRTGQLPPDYFEEGDPVPWGLRIKDSRSNILWQVISGMMDRHPEFGTAYMALALDQALSDTDYALEIKKLNKDWGNYMEHAGLYSSHHHSAMKGTYTRVSCPACSMLTALATQDEGMHALFQELLPLNTADRRAALQEKGLIPLLDLMIPKPEPVIPR